MSEFVKVIDTQALSALANLERAGIDQTPAMRAIAQELAYQTERNFAAGGRPTWTPLKNPTERRKGGSILQDTGALAASVTTDFGEKQATIGSNLVYAAIHQFGGKIKREASSGSVRLRTDRKGALVRQGSDGKASNLAVFAGKKHKQAVEKAFTRDAYEFDMPARPYLPIHADGSLQPEIRTEVLEIVLRHLKKAAGV